MARISIETLKKREDFLRVQAAPRIGCESLVLHTLANKELPEGSARVGFTVTKRCGNAVTRNRIKRRLRALARKYITELGRGATDYVLIGKPATATLPYDTLTRDMVYALRKISSPLRGEDKGGGDLSVSPSHRKRHVHPHPASPLKGEENI